MKKRRKAVRRRTVKKPAKKRVVRKTKKRAVRKTRAVAISKPKERKLVMTDSFVSEDQLAFLLGKTPARHIYERPAKGGGKWTYVTGVYVTKVLNYVFGWNWDFEIKDKGREGNLVWVQGRLTIRDKEGMPRVIKEQFGRADIKMRKGSSTPLDYGNDLKAASTDALKKCASELGIAGDVYGKEEFKEVASKVSEQQIEKEVEYEPAEQKEPEPKASKAVSQVLTVLTKKGATTEIEALNLLARLTGLKWKDFNVRDKAAELALKALLNK